MVFEEVGGGLKKHCDFTWQLYLLCTIRNCEETAAKLPLLLNLQITSLFLKVKNKKSPLISVYSVILRKVGAKNCLGGREVYWGWGCCILVIF